MRHKLSLVLTLCAWLLATGSHWDVVQTFAWGRMIATYSQSMSFTQAVQKTFSAGATCSVCEIVATAKSQDAANPAAPTAPGKTLEKIHLVFAPAPAAPLLLSYASFSWSLSDQSAPSLCRAAPPVPPPRALT
ncbi:MAG: hypothetical protein NTZ29_16120 [Verrucomicrobia bacterium]|nr:hypothetical protein [Verrucomicrobiota bacterium]